MLSKMIASMEAKIVAFSKKGFDIPEDEMAILKKWYFEGAINFKANGFGLQADLYGPCLEDPLWKDVYSMTWLRIFTKMCKQLGVATKISRASVAEYCKSTANYKIYPVVSTKLEDYDEILEKDLLVLIQE